MADLWFVCKPGGQQWGPIPATELRRLAEVGVVRPETLVRQANSARWVRAEHARGLFQRSTPPPSPWVGESSPPPLSARSPAVPESGATNSDVSGTNSIRAGLCTTALSEASEKPERIWPVTWVAIIVGSGTVLLLLWALVFRGGSAPQQQAEKDQPRLAATQPGEPVPQPTRGTSAPAYAPEGNGEVAVWTPELGERFGIPPPPDWHDKSTPGAAPAAESRSSPATGPTGPAAETDWDALANQILGPPGTPPAGEPVRQQGTARTPKQSAVPAPQQPGTAPVSPLGPEEDIEPATGGVKVLELADLAELVGPSVVQVNVTGPEEAATGSGFVLDKQGTIVTNYHVIEDATAGTIVFSDRTGAPITGYLGVWPEKDIALVRVECPPEKLHPLRLATSAPRQGERVAAFGSPLGLQQSVSEGIVSAVRESKELEALGSDVNARLIQTTTPISGGNSGGPLVDMKGMVVGINTMTLRSLGGENVNFAVAAVEIPPLLLAKKETPVPLPASDPAADGARRIPSPASAHVIAGEYDLAIADCTEAIRRDPKNAGAYFWRGESYRRKKDYDRAIADFTHAIRLNPKDAGAYYFRGQSYYFKGDSDTAIADCTEAIRLDPENALDPQNAGAYFWRGRSYDRKGDYDRAIADYTEVIRLDPTDADVYYFRGASYCFKDDYDSAIADFTEAIRLDPQNAVAYLWRGKSYYVKGDYDRAIAGCTEAIRLDPENTDAYFLRGNAYSAKRDYDSAIADYTEAIRLDPQNAGAYHWRGLAYGSRGQPVSAQRDYAKARRLGYEP